MNKMLLWFLVTIFGVLGSWIPTWWHAGYLSGWSLLGGTLGSLFGIFVWVKFKDSLDI